MGKLVEASVDTAGLERKMRRLSSGLDPASTLAAQRAAADVARKIGDATPVLTGRLRGTVGVTGDGRGYGVTYGGGLPYAHYIDVRTNAVEDATKNARTEFKRAEETAASFVIRGL